MVFFFCYQENGKQKLRSGDLKEMLLMDILLIFKPIFVITLFFLDN